MHLLAHCVSDPAIHQLERVAGRSAHLARRVARQQLRAGRQSAAVHRAVRMLKCSHNVHTCLVLVQVQGRGKARSVTCDAVVQAGETMSSLPQVHLRRW